MNTDSEIQNTENGAQPPESTIPNPASAPPPEPSTFNIQPATKITSAGIEDPPSDSQPSTNNPQLSSRRRNGNVARLPKDVRDRINQMLDDGIPYAEIVDLLGPDGKTPTPRCVMSWKNGGYKDYLHQQELLAQCRARQFRVAPLLNERNHVNTFQATQQLASAQICETVVDIGTDILRKALAENPLNYFRMLNAFSRLTTGGLKCERHLLDDLERKARLKTHKGRKKGVSKEAFRKMEEKLKLMLPALIGTKTNFNSFSLK